MIILKFLDTYEHQVILLSYSINYVIKGISIICLFVGYCGHLVVIQFVSTDMAYWHCCRIPKEDILLFLSVRVRIKTNNSEFLDVFFSPPVLLFQSTQTHQPIERENFILERCLVFVNTRAV